MSATQRLQGLMDEFALADLQALSDYIIRTSAQAMHQAIAALPDGQWRHSMRIDGNGEPVDLVATLSIDGDKLCVDYAGSSAVSRSFAGKLDSEGTCSLTPTDCPGVIPQVTIGSMSAASKRTTSSYLASASLRIEFQYSTARSQFCAVGE